MVGCDSLVPSTVADQPCAPKLCCRRFCSGVDLSLGISEGKKMLMKINKRKEPQQLETGKKSWDAELELDLNACQICDGGTQVVDTDLQNHSKGI